jgi:hypothetical protein
MNAKPNSIGILPVMRSGLRVQGLHGPVASDVRLCAVRIQGTAPAAKRKLRAVMPSVDGRVGELWETLSYAVLRLCGLTGIGLCFL